MLICSSDASAVLITMTDIKGVWVWVFKFLEISGFGRTYLLKKNFPVPKQSDFFFFFLMGMQSSLYFWNDMLQSLGHTLPGT